MKKTIALLIAISMIFALCACGSTVAEAPAEKPAEEAAAAPEATENPETELEKLIREAGEGDVEAMMKLADMYLNGEDVAQDTKESISWYTKAAEAGNTEAMKNLGSYYLFAEDEKDPEKGLEWYTKAAETGDLESMISLGSYLIYGGDNKDPEKGLEWLTKAADAGYTEAMYMLSSAYKYSGIVPQDLEKATEYTKKAAAAGHDYAMMEAFNMYQFENTLSQADYAALVEQYNEATKDNDFGLKEFDLSFKSTDMDGNTVDESVFAGKDLTMLYFWDPQQSASDLAKLQVLSDTYADQGFQVIGVVNNLKWDNSTGQQVFVKDEDIKAILDSNKVSFLNLHRHRLVEEDEHQVFLSIVGEDYAVEILNDLETTIEPTAVFVDGEGNLIHYPDTPDTAKKTLKSVSDILSQYHTALQRFSFVFDNDKLYDGIKELAEVTVTGAKGDGWTTIVEKLLSGEATWTEEQIAEWDAMKYEG